MLKKIQLYTSLFILSIFQFKAYSSDFCFSANYGPGYRLMTLKDSASPSFESYFEHKKSGKTVNIEALWYSDNQGFGLAFRSFFNSTSGKNIILSGLERVDMSDRIRVNYFSLQYHNRFHYRESRLWGDFGVGLGLVRYRDDGKLFESGILTTGKTYGLNADLSCNYSITKHLSFSISAGFFTAVLSEWIKADILETLEPKEGLTRLDLNGGIKVFF